MRFSYVMLPDGPLTEHLAAIKKADELGFYAVYAADETWHKDPGCSSRPLRPRRSRSGWGRASRP
jgi:hypothetical protein